MSTWYLKWQWYNTSWCRYSRSIDGGHLCWSCWSSYHSGFSRCFLWDWRISSCFSSYGCHLYKKNMNTWIYLHMCGQFVGKKLKTSSFTCNICRINAIDSVASAKLLRIPYAHWIACICCCLNTNKYVKKKRDSLIS